MSQRLSVSALAAIVVVSVVVLAPIASTAPVSAQSTPPATSQFAVAQGTTCTAVSPVTNTNETVEQFYDYREPYSSVGTIEYQESQETVMLFYVGSNGTSLVTLNDKLGDDTQGSTITMEFDGLPADGSWAVRDDSYDGQDDDWHITETTTIVDWKWVDDRTDGGAYRGFGGFGGMTVIEPGFNEDAAHWGDWPESGDSQYRMGGWTLKGAGGTSHSLDMDRPAFVHRGGCLDTAPEASVSGQQQAETGDTVTFDATASTDAEAEIAGYEWDFEGDGEVETVTTEPSTSHAFADADNYTVTVTAFDTYGNAAESTTTVNVTAPASPPNADLTVPGSATVDEPATLDASGSEDEGSLTEFRWDFDGDGTIDRNTTSATVDYPYNESGEKNPEVTVVDNDGSTDTASASLTVESSNSPPSATLDVQAEATVDESVTLDASDSTDEDDDISEYRWDFDGDGTVDDTTDVASTTTTYDAADTYTATVTVVDTAGQTGNASGTVEVTAAASPPDAALNAPEEATVNESVTLDASGSSDEGAITQFQWDFDGDGEVDATTEENTASHTYTETGDVEPVVTVVDNDGANDTASTTISVTEPESLAAELSVETENPTANEPVSFDAGASTPTEDIVSYEWTFEDGGNATGDVVQHTFEDSGSYTVTLEVQSAAGSVAKTNTTVEVEPADSSGGDGSDGSDGNDNGGSNDGGDGNNDAGGGNNGGNNNAGGGGGGAGGAGGGGGGSSEPADPAEPDIGPANVSVSDRTLVVGDSLVVDATLTNDGDAAGEREVEFAVDGTVVESRTLVVEPNETRTVSFTRQLSTPGNRTVSVGESALTVMVEPAEPDISVAGVEQTNDSVLAGKAFELTAYVENTGEAEGTTTVELEMFGEVVDTESVTVPAGETAEVTFTREIQAPGSYTASVGNATVSLEVAGENATTTAESTTAGGSSDVLSPGFGPSVAVLALALAAAGRFVVRRKE